MFVRGEQALPSGAPLWYHKNSECLHAWFSSLDGDQSCCNSWCNTDGRERAILVKVSGASNLIPPLICSGTSRVQLPGQTVAEDAEHLSPFSHAQGDFLLLLLSVSLVVSFPFMFTPVWPLGGVLGKWVEPRQGTFGSRQLVFSAAFLWIHACLCFYITAGVTPSLLLCWRVLLKPLTSLFNKICLNTASTLKRFQKSPGRVEEIVCWCFSSRLAGILAPLRISS